MLRKLQRDNELLEHRIAHLTQHRDQLLEATKQLKSGKVYRAYNFFAKIKRILGLVILQPRTVVRWIKIIIKYGFKPGIAYIKATELMVGSVTSINAQYITYRIKHYPSTDELREQTVISKTWAERPLLSIVIPVFNTPVRYLEELIGSISRQSYQDWEICIADDASTSKQTREYLDLLEEQLPKNKLRIVRRTKSGHISDATNSAVELARGNFYLFVDHDDRLWSNALFEIAKAIKENDQVQYIYTDEEKISENGEKSFDPFFKPAWSPDYLHSTNYISHLSAISKEAFNDLGGLDGETNGAQDWDLILRLSDYLAKKYPDFTTDGYKQRRIVHIPKILYSWRVSSGSTASDQSIQDKKSYVVDAQREALQRDLKRKSLAGNLELQPFHIWRVRYKIIGDPMVSIIIPTKDQFDLLTRCLKSIKKSTYKNIELVIVDTGSTDTRVKRLYEKVKSEFSHFRLLNWKEKFNFAAVCNYGVSEARGKYLVLLNNDTEVITPDWIESMLEYAQRKDVGAVGCKLLYPDRRIQHAGVVLGIGAADDQGVAGHFFKYWHNEANDYFKATQIEAVRDFSAVTAACLMISKAKYLEIKGQDVGFRIAFNDVDFCLRLLAKGYLNIYTPYASFYHHESVSVGKPDEGNRDLDEFAREIAAMKKKWGKLLTSDPYYNPNIANDRENFELKI